MEAFQHAWLTLVQRETANPIPKKYGETLNLMACLWILLRPSVSGKLAPNALLLGVAGITYNPLLVQFGVVSLFEEHLHTFSGNTSIGATLLIGPCGFLMDRRP